MKRAEQKKIAEEAEIKRAREIEVANIEKARDLALSEQQKKIAVAQKTEEEAAALAKANLAKAEAVRAEEQVETARLTEIANRDKAVAVIEAQREAERQAVEIKVAAEAEKAAAEDRAAAIITQADADKQRDMLHAEGVFAVGKAEAEALQLRNTAENSISADAAALRLRLALTNQLKGIVEASTKPLEKVESIRIIDLDGFNPGAGVGRSGDGEGSGAGTADRIVGAALSHRALAPLVDSVLAEVGITEGLGALVAGRSAVLSPTTPATKAIATDVAEVLDRMKAPKKD